MTPRDAIQLTLGLLSAAIVLCGFGLLIAGFATRGRRCRVGQLKRQHLFDCLHRVDPSISHDDHAVSGPMSVYLEERK